MLRSSRCSGHYIIYDIFRASRLCYLVQRAIFDIVTAMLTLIIWIFIGIIALTILYYIGAFIFAFLGVKKILTWATDEANQLPKDYAKLRKEVKNEGNNHSESFESFLKGVFVRWYDKLFK